MLLRKAYRLGAETQRDRFYVSPKHGIRHPRPRADTCFTIIGSEVLVCCYGTSKLPMSFIERPMLAFNKVKIWEENVKSSKFMKPIYWKPRCCINKKSLVSVRWLIVTSSRVPTSPSGLSSWSRLAGVHLGGQVWKPLFGVMRGWSRRFTIRLNKNRFWLSSFGN